MYSTLQSFHEQFNTSLSIAYQLDLSSLDHFQPRTIVYAGMGGSTLAADLFLNLWGETFGFPIVRDYDLPQYVDSNTLVLCASYSGNTEETLSCLEQAIERKAKVVVLANGGKLKDLAISHNIPYLAIPDCIQPRCSIGYFFASVTALFTRLGLLQVSADLFTHLSDFIAQGQKNFDGEGKKLAAFLKDRVPLLYGPTLIHSALRIIKIKINENAKVPAFYNCLPELNHNEMVSFTQTLGLPWSMVFFATPLMHSRIARRIEVMKSTLTKGINHYSVLLPGKTLVETLFGALMIGDYASYWLALEYGIDPVPVALVESFKKQLG